MSMATSSGSSTGKPNNNRHACAACKHQRKRCSNNCVMAPYFPADKTKDFEAVHKLFGVKNVSKGLKSLDMRHRESAVKSLIWEAWAWTQDNVGGPLERYRKLELELQSLRSQLEILSLAATGFHTSHPIVMFPTSQRAMNSFYTGLLQEEQVMESQGVVPYPRSFPDVQTDDFQREVMRERQGRVGLQSTTFPAPSFDQLVMRVQRSHGCEEIGYDRIIQNGGNHGRDGIEAVVLQGGGALGRVDQLAVNMGQGQPRINQVVGNHIAMSNWDGGPLLSGLVPDPHAPVQRSRSP